MSKFNRKTKVDANQSEIFDWLRAHGVFVESMAAAGGITDSFTYARETGFLEIKIPGSKAKYTRHQLLFIARCPAPVGIAKDKEFALAFALEPKKYCLTQKQKDKLAFFLQSQPKDKKFFTPAEVEAILNIKNEAK